jgi:probable rRNA maturation factor
MIAQTPCYDAAKVVFSMPPGPVKRSASRLIDVQIFPEFRPSLKAPFVRKAAQAALKTADGEGDRSLSVVIADDATLHDLNLRFRGFDEPTDVLSFGDESDASLAPDDADGELAFPDIPEESGSLGEIVVSYPLAVRQAGEHNVTVDEEVSLLIVHGVLHLLGYDHAGSDDETAMKAAEALALGLLFSGKAAETTQSDPGVGAGGAG